MPKMWNKNSDNRTILWKMESVRRLSGFSFFRLSMLQLLFSRQPRKSHAPFAIPKVSLKDSILNFTISRGKFKINHF